MAGRVVGTLCRNSHMDTDQSLVVRNTSLWMTCHNRSDDNDGVKLTVHFLRNLVHVNLIFLSGKGATVTEGSDILLNCCEPLIGL